MLLWPAQWFQLSGSPWARFSSGFIQADLGPELKGSRVGFSWFLPTKPHPKEDILGTRICLALSPSSIDRQENQSLAGTVYAVCNPNVY